MTKNINYKSSILTTNTVLFCYMLQYVRLNYFDDYVELILHGSNDANKINKTIVIRNKTSSLFFNKSII